MRELAKVVIGVAVTEAVLWALRIWSWTAFSFRQWPWLFERFAVLFPVTLVAVLLAIRRWPLARSHLAGAGVAGAVAGLVSSTVARYVAQLITSEERAVVWNSLRTAGIGDMLLIESLFAFILTLGWLHGALASAATIGLDRLDEAGRARQRRASNLEI